MDIERRCSWCGKTFVAHSYGTRYCSVKCKRDAKKSRTKRMNGTENATVISLPEIGMLGEKPFLTPKDVAILLGTTSTSIYRYIYQGIIKAIKLSENRIVIRRSDLDSLFDNATTFKKKKYGRKVESEYYTMREIMKSTAVPTRKFSPEKLQLPVTSSRLVRWMEETSMLLKFTAHSTPSDSSFLSEYVHRNGKGLKTIRMAKNWFADGLKIIFPSTRLQGISFLTENNDELQETTRSLLAYFNTGISDVRLYKIKKEDVNLSSDLLDNILSKAKNGKAYSMAATVGGEMLLFEVNANGGYEIYKHKAVHRNLTSGIEVVFDLSEESNGSIRLLDFIPMLIDLKQNEVDYLIDEIDRSMHPMLSQKILECYFSGLESGRDTQLIFSTHECNLLNLDLIRADEV